MWLELLGVLSCASLGFTLPKFEVYWESELNYLYNGDELDSPWHIDLGNVSITNKLE